MSISLTMKIPAINIMQDWNGWLILDKPYGMSSAHAVAKVKRLLKPKKIGHGGTLDPLASGILPLALGEATKAFQFVAANRKTYRFTVQWGQERSTDDLEGEITNCSDNRPSQDALEALIPEFIGEIWQAPPAFSAIKVQGKRAYDLARGGEALVLPPRLVHVETLSLQQVMADSATFEMACGKGTYVRSLARDLGRKLGCFGHVTQLRRLSVGKFHEKNAISLEKLEELVHSAALDEQLLPIYSVLDDIPALEVDSQSARRLMQGQGITLFSEPSEGLFQILHDRRLVAIAKVQGNLVKPVRVFLA